jgi:two-component system sensor histidine kinase YesM
MKGKRGLALLLGIVMLFGAAFLVLQNKTVIRPVVRLSSEAKNFRDGSFSIITHTESGDEIGNLNRSLQEMSGYIKNLIDIKYKSELSQREIELEYLQSQVNPHFLYNTLDSIRWMAVLRQQPEIAGQIEALSNLFRHSLNSGEKYTTLKKEVEHLRAYVQIQKIRFEDNMSFQIDVDEALFPCKIIKLMIQPLVENAVVHGLEPKCGKGHVHIIIDEWETKLRCRVIDDGVGIDVEAVSKYIAGESGAGKPFALKNIQNRINLEYGEGYGLCVTRSKDGGTAVQILLPIIM